MEKIIHYFVTHVRSAIVLSLTLFLMGVMGLNSMRSESRPPVNFSSVTITTVYPGSSPEEVEETVTRKIEEAIRTVDGLKDVRSLSQAGLSEIRVRIDSDYYDVDEVVADLQKEVQAVSDLPAEIDEDPSFVEAKTNEIPIFEIVLEGTNKDRLRDRTAELLEDLLEDVKGVADVRLSGYGSQELQILLNRKKLRRLHVGISEVFDAVKTRSVDIPAGSVEGSKKKNLVRVRGESVDPETIKNFVIRSNFSGQKIRIRDVARVISTEKEKSTRVLFNGSPGTLLIVTKKGLADTPVTSQMVAERLKNFKFPEGIKYHIYNDESIRISNQLNIVATNAVAGLILVVIVLLLFLPGGIGIWSAFSLPLAIFGTVALLSFYGVTFNTITMLAFVIAIGMLVDNSVVISENYARLRSTGLDRTKAAVKAASQFWLPISATVATTVAAFLPMLVTKGIMGQFIRWIPIVVSVALIMSLIESLVLLPSRIQFSIFKNPEKEDGKVKETRMSRWFESFMKRAIKLRYLVAVSIFGILMGSLVLTYVGNRFELFPDEDVEFYFATFNLPKSTRIEVTENVAKDLTQSIQEALGAENIKYIVSRVGISQIGFGDRSKKVGDHVGMVQVVIPEERARVLDTNFVLKKLRDVKHEKTESLSFTALAGGPPKGKPVEVTLRSNKFEELQAVFNKMKSALAEMDGVVDIDDDVDDVGQEYIVDLDFDRIAEVGLSTQVVGSHLRTALEGNIAGSYVINNRDVDLRVRYDGASRSSIENLRKTFIMESRKKLMLPLSSFASVKLKEGEPTRKGYNFQRSMTILANVEPSKITSVKANQNLKRLFDESLSSEYPSVSMTQGGEAESTKESVQSLGMAMGLAFIGIFVILIFLFNSVGIPAIILSSIPLGLVGVSVSFFVHQKPIGFLAMIGVVGLAGVVVNSGIVLMSYYFDLLKEGMKSHEALARSSAHRLRAVLVTSLTTIGGLLPTAYGLGGADRLLIPMTLALAWGLASGTLLTLVWVPCGYAITQDIKSLFGRVVSLGRRKKDSTAEQVLAH